VPSISITNDQRSPLLAEASIDADARAALLRELRSERARQRGRSMAALRPAPATLARRRALAAAMARVAA
jgi:hypothetical protein